MATGSSQTEARKIIADLWHRITSDTDQSHHSCVFRIEAQCDPCRHGKKWTDRKLFVHNAVFIEAHLLHLTDQRGSAVSRSSANQPINQPTPCQMFTIWKKVAVSVHSMSMQFVVMARFSRLRSIIRHTSNLSCSSNKPKLLPSLHCALPNFNLRHAECCTVNAEL